MMPRNSPFFQRQAAWETLDSLEAGGAALVLAGLAIASRARGQEATANRIGRKKFRLRRS
jgi:hypothetical protein